MRDWIQRCRLMIVATAVTAISCVLGCGGEVGGGPSGIGAALTNVQLSAAVLALGLQDPQLVSANIPPGAVAAVDADEFELTLTGAGFDRRDVKFTFPVGKGVDFNPLGTTLEEQYLATFAPGVTLSPSVKVVPMFQEMDSAPRGTPEPAEETVVENGVDRIRVKPPLRADGNLLFEIATRTVRISPTETRVIEAGTLRENVVNFRAWEGLFDYRVIAERILNKLNFEVVLEFQGGSLPENAPYRVLFTSRQTLSILEQPGNPNSPFARRLVLTKGYNEIGGLGDPTLQYSAPVLLTVNVSGIPVAATGIRVTAVEQSINDSVGGSTSNNVITRFEIDIPRNGSNFSDGAEQTQFIIINRLRRFRLEARAFIETEGSVGRTSAVAYGATRGAPTETTATGFDLTNNGFELSIPAGVGSPPARSVTMRSQIVDFDATTASLISASYASLRGDRQITISPTTASVLFFFNTPGEDRDTATYSSRVNVIDVGVDSIAKVVSIDLPNPANAEPGASDALVYSADDRLDNSPNGTFSSSEDITLSEAVIRVSLQDGAFPGGVIPVPSSVREHNATLRVNSSGDLEEIALTSSIPAVPSASDWGYPRRARSIVFIASESATADGPVLGAPYIFRAIHEASGNNDLGATVGATVRVIDRNRFFQITAEARSELGGAGVTLARGQRLFDGLPGAQLAVAAGSTVPFTESNVTNGSLVLRYQGSDGPITLQRGQTVALTGVMTVGGVSTNLPATLFDFSEANDPGNFLSVSGAQVTFRANAPSGVRPASEINDIRVRVTYVDPVHGSMTDDLTIRVTGSGSGTVN